MKYVLKAWIYLYNNWHVIFTLFFLLTFLNAHHVSFDIVSCLFTVSLLTLDNVTVPLNTRTHLCKSTNCESQRDKPRYCYCDPACVVFNDCCADYNETRAAKKRNMRNLRSYLNNHDIRAANVECLSISTPHELSYYRTITKCPHKDFGDLRMKCEFPIGMTGDNLLYVPVTDSLGI